MFLKGNGQVEGFYEVGTALFTEVLLVETLTEYSKNACKLTPDQVCSVTKEWTDRLCNAKIEWFAMIIFKDNDFERERTELGPHNFTCREIKTKIAGLSFCHSTAGS